jgi:DNA-binding beta-propeller fold protein YncE
MAYRIDASGTLSPLDPAFAPLKPGSGPRHMAFAPNGRFAYTANELNSTVTAFSYDKATGRLTEIQTLPSITGYEGANGVNYPAEIEVDAKGRFVYSANRRRWETHSRQPDERWRKISASFCPGPQRQIPVRGKPEFREHRGVPRGSDDRSSDRHRRRTQGCEPHVRRVCAGAIAL